MSEKQRKWWEDRTSNSHETGHLDPRWRRCAVCGDGHMSSSENGGHYLADRDELEKKRANGYEK